jgi:hypothetical protein
MVAILKTVSGPGMILGRWAQVGFVVDAFVLGWLPWWQRGLWHRQPKISICMGPFLTVQGLASFCSSPPIIALMLASRRSGGNVLVCPGSILLAGVTL